MLNFIKNSFKGLVEVLLWINLIGCAVGGAVIGYGMREEGTGGFVGLILGAIVGLLINVCFGGLVTVLLNIDKNLEEMKNGIGKNGILKNGIGLEDVSGVSANESSQAKCGNCAKKTTCSTYKDYGKDDSNSCEKHRFS